MAQIFKKGDLVMLKSGGTKMTVEKYASVLISLYEMQESESTLVCKWFDNEYKLVSHEFEQETLVRYEE